MQARQLQTKSGLLRELNPGPLAPEARIIPLDQAAGLIAFNTVNATIAAHVLCASAQMLLLQPMC